MEDRVLRELPPLLDSDFMYVADRRKKEFTYPIHKHEVFELNYVEERIPSTLLFRHWP